MKLAWSKAHALTASLFLVVLTNAIALGGVAYNRGGQPHSTLELTERELRISRRDWLDNETSGIDLDVRWRIRPRKTDSYEPEYSWDRELHWLSEAQKKQLGFIAPKALTRDDAGDSTWDPPTREAFVVLENDGATHRAAIEQARKHLARATKLAAANSGVKIFRERLDSAREQLKEEESFATRLFLIDVDPDADALRARYSDRSRYAIVRAHLDAAIANQEHVLHSAIYVTSLDIDTISVPHEFRAIIEPLSTPNDRYSYKEQAPRFEATVHWGRRLEPWITQVRKVAVAAGS
jgi:hypothetical protein